MRDHTPTPWRVRVREINGYRVDQIEGRDRQFVVSFDGEPFEKQQADAAFIVRACNSHDALIEALRKITHRYVTLADSGDCGFWDPETEEEVIAARAALKLAEAK